MRIARFSFFPVLLASCLLLALSINSASAANKPPPPPDMRKVIKSVDKDASSVVIIYMESKLTHTYKIDDVTALMVNGVAGKITDIKPGMVVTDYTERDNDDLDALTLTGYGTEAAKPAKKK